MANAKTFSNWRQWAKNLKTEVRALALAWRDPRTPWYAKVFTACVVAYALSPIDLIPDFIPVLGYLDDLVLIPLGVLLAVRMMPALVMAEARERARTLGAGPRALAGAIFVIAVWLCVLVTVVGVLVAKYR